ncbi:MAG: hypothetical protein OJF51_002914 [Nitrospira sp.]|nr:MAG: hypothetical protein OJF51_002914 [Nitrospira sp.]
METAAWKAVTVGEGGRQIDFGITPGLEALVRTLRNVFPTAEKTSDQVTIEAKRGQRRNEQGQHKQGGGYDEMSRCMRKNDTSRNAGLGYCGGFVIALGRWDEQRRDTFAIATSPRAGRSEHLCSRR